MTDHYAPELADPGDGDMFGAFEDAVLRNQTEPPEPLGTCVVHGDYWTDDCHRCGWTSRAAAGEERAR